MMPVVSTNQYRPASRLLALLCSTALTGVVLSVASPMPAKAQQVWVGTNPGDDFNSDTNWDTNTVPGTGGTAIFRGNSATTNLSTSFNTQVGTVLFDVGAPSFTITLGEDFSFNGSGPGIVNDSGAEQTMVVDGHVLFFSGGATAGSATLRTVNGGSIYFRGASNGGTSTIDLQSGLLLVNLASGGLEIGALEGSGQVMFGLDATEQHLTVGNLNNDIAFAGRIVEQSGVTGSLTKVGTGTMTLSGNNSYSGGTTISAGTILAANDIALGLGQVTLGGGTLALSGATTLGNVINLVSTGTIRFDADSNGSLNGDIITNGQMLTLNAVGAGTINGDVDGSTSYIGKSGAGTLTINGVVDGIGAGIMAGSGTLVLNNANTFGGGSGSTTIGNATLVVGNDDALSTSRLTSNSAGSVLSANRDVSLANNVSLFNGGGLTVDSAGHAIDMSGAFQVIGAPAPITKTGAGTLTLSGNNSSFTGDAIVSEGTLLVNGAFGGSAAIGDGGTLIVGDDNHSTASLAGDVTVDTGGTLGGIGAVGTTTIALGGTLAPGNSIGTLTMNGDLKLNDGALLDYEFGTPGAAALAGTSDRIDVAQDLMLDGTLNMAQSADVTDGMAGIGYYRLMTYGGDLTDNGLAIGDTSAFSGVSDFEIQTGGGNVDLFVGVLGDDELQHWQGGDGIWNATNPQWLNQGGTFPVTWAGNHAAFKNQPGGFSGGMIDVTGTQSFAGLQFVDDGYQLEGSGALETLAGGSEIRVLANASAEIATEITGAGGITKTQGGTLILSGQNSYEGGTIIAGGAVQVAEDSNLGDPMGGLLFDGGALRVTGTGYASTNRAITIGAGGGGFDIDAVGNVFDLGQDIVGGGDLVKRGEGVLRLTGANAYGNTLVEDGWLIGDAGSISGHIANAGIVSFEQGTNGSFTGDITGLDGIDGIMVKNGLGTLTLEGISNLDWTIAAGGLVTEATQFGGDVRLDGAATALSFADRGNATYSGEISGAGLFSLDGEGTVLLTGDSSGFSGQTALNAGKLLVGNADGNGTLGGSLDVLDGGTLGGSGTVGSGSGSLVTVASGGTLSPGNSIGTLTIDGDLVFDVGSRFAVEVNPEGAESDLVTVNGSATLNGGAVAHIGANGEYDLRSTYTVLSAGALTGEFDDVTSDFAFLTPDLIYNYGAGTIDLGLARNDRDFASVAQTPNQIATAEGIEGIGFEAGHAVYDAIAQLADDDDLIRTSFDALSGEIHASVQTALIEDSQFVRNTANDRIRAAFGDAGASYVPVLAFGPGNIPMAVAADHAGPVVWSAAFGSWGSTDSDGDAASLDRSTGGVLVGTDTQVSDWRVGVLAGYSHLSFDVDDRASSGSSDNYHLGLYGGTQWGDIAFRTGAAYTWHDIETNRAVSISGLADSLSGDYSAGTFQAFGELGYGIEIDSNTRLEPFANLAHVSLHRNSFAEQGGAATLSVNSGSTDVTFTTLGLRGEHSFALGTVDATLRGMIGWRHAFGEVTTESTHAFSAGDAFTIAGVPIARDSAVIESGLDLNLTPEATFGLSYIGQLTSDAYDHGFKANLSVKF